MATQTLIDKTQLACDILGLDRSKVKSVIMNMPPDGFVTVDVVLYPDPKEIDKLVRILCAPVHTPLMPMAGSGNSATPERPANCRNRLRDEGKPYPRSGCAHCKNGGLMGCPFEKDKAQ